MDKKYRLMIYFAHSTLVMYSKDIVSHDKMSVGEFMEQNKESGKPFFLMVAPHTPHNPWRQEDVPPEYLEQVKETLALPVPY